MRSATACRSLRPTTTARRALPRLRLLRRQIRQRRPLLLPLTPWAAARALSERPTKTDHDEPLGSEGWMRRGDEVGREETGYEPLDEERPRPTTTDHPPQKGGCSERHER